MRKVVLALGTAGALGALAGVALTFVAPGPPVGAQAPPAASAWSTLAPMPTPRQELSVAVLEGKVFVLAGYDTQGASTVTVEVYDPTRDTWARAAPLPVATNHNAAATVNGRLYAFGGTTPRAFVYDPARDAWSEVASMRYQHGGTPAVAVIGGRLYVAGGTGPGMVGNEVEVYDPSANAWRTLASMGVPRNHTAGGVIGERLYVVGGRGDPRAATALEAYETTTNAWTTRAPMPTGRSGIAAGVVAGRLYVFGGELPRLFGAQAEGCAPIVRALRPGEEIVIRPEVPKTIARSLAIGNPADGLSAARAIRESGGAGIAVSDEAIRDGIAGLAQTAGVFTETAGGVTVAGAIFLGFAGELTADDEVVLCITGNGLKTPDAVPARLLETPVIAPRLAEVVALAGRDAESNSRI